MIFTTRTVYNKQIYFLSFIETLPLHILLILINHLHYLFLLTINILFTQTIPLYLKTEIDFEVNYYSFQVKTL